MRSSLQPNYYILSTVLILIVIGILVLADASAPLSMKQFGNAGVYLFKIMAFTILALIIGLACYKKDMEWFKKKSLPFLVISIVLCLIVFLPVIGLKIRGAQRWINLGIMTLQPSDFLKLASILFLAAFISDNPIKKWKDFFLFLAINAVIFFPIVLQKDMSNLMVMAAYVFTMLVVSSANKKFIWALVILGIILMSGLVFIESYRLERVQTMLNPDLDPMGSGWQTRQALITIGSGGFWGIGLGLGRQKLIVPQAMTDLIYSILCEQLGFIGGVGVIVLFLMLFWQGVKVALESRDEFYKLTAMGITVWIVAQAFVNISSAVGLFPITGVPLPFISYGGSALIAEIIAIAILLNISKA